MTRDDEASLKVTLKGAKTLFGHGNPSFGTLHGPPHNRVLSPEAAAARSKRVDSLGNLTLVTQKLNGSLSHRPWSDDPAALVAPTGKLAGLGKQSLLRNFSILVLNKALVDGHAAEWTDDDIGERSREMTERICAIWPRYNAAAVPATSESEG